MRPIKLSIKEDGEDGGKIYQLHMNSNPGFLPCLETVLPLSSHLPYV